MTVLKPSRRPDSTSKSTKRETGGVFFYLNTVSQGDHGKLKGKGRIPASAAKGVKVASIKNLITLPGTFGKGSVTRSKFEGVIISSKVSNYPDLTRFLPESIYSGEFMILPMPDLIGTETAKTVSEIELFGRTLEFLAKAAAGLRGEDKLAAVRTRVANSASDYRSALLANTQFWFNSKDACALEGLGAANPSGHLADRREKLEIFGVQRGREWLYPRFQWSNDDGRPYKCIKTILEIEPKVSRWFLVRWFDTPSPFLGKKRPAELVPHYKSWGRLVDAAEKNLLEAPLNSEFARADDSPHS